MIEWIESELADARAKMAEAHHRRESGQPAYHFQRGRQQALIDMRSQVVELARGAMDNDRDGER